MPDLSPVVGSIADVLAPILRPVVSVAIKKLLTTTLGMLVLAVVVVCYAVVRLADVVWWQQLMAVSFLLVGCTALAGVLAGKRAVFGALAEALGRSQLGARAINAVFEGIFRLRQAGAPSIPSVAVSATASTVERVPLAQAESLLRRAIDAFVSSDVDNAKGIRASIGRAIRRRLGEKVESVTLARFRTEAHQGIDLQRVQEELAAKADALIVAQLHSAVQKLTVLIVGGLLLSSVVIVEVLRHSGRTG
jgi:hypothetical protein